MSETQTGHGRAHLRYRTIDLLFVVGFGLVSGVAFRGYGLLIDALRPIVTAFPPLEGVYAGIWALPAAIAMLVVRKPGAALATMWIGAVVEALLASTFGWTVLISGPVVASGFELAGFLARYRSMTLKHLMIGAFVSMTAQWVWEQYIFFPEWDWPFRFVHLALFYVSGVLLLALPAPKIVEALGASGALNAFPPGKERALSRA